MHGGEKKDGRSRQLWLVLLIAMGLIAIAVSGYYYIIILRSNLSEVVIQDVLSVTRQQKQAFDNFLVQDQERLHSYAEFFSRTDYFEPEDIQRQLTMFDDLDAVYSVINLDEGWFCSSASDKIRDVDEDNLTYYGSLKGAGVRSSYIGIFSKEPKFGFYESFYFTDGSKGLIQKSYDRTKVSETFSLSFYNGQGFAYVVNENGDVLLRSVGMLGDHQYNNIIEVLTENHGLQEDSDILTSMLAEREEKSRVFLSENGESYAYTCVPVNAVEGWTLVSIVRMSAITAEANKVLQNSKIAVVFLVVFLTVCVAFAVLIWHTNQGLAAKDRTIEYQERLFVVLTTYLSSNTNDVYMMLDPKSMKVEYVSPNVERVLGVSAEDVMESTDSIGTPVRFDSDPIDYNEFWNLEPGDTLEGIQTERIDLTSGEHKNFQESVYCTKVQDKTKIIFCMSDRTQDRKTRDTLAEALRIAQTANQAKSDFLGSVSHDIRTPMNAIIGFISLLRKDAQDPDLVMEYTQRIDAASQHLLGLINDVLDINKIESGNATINISEVNLADIIDEINTIIRPQTRAKNQTFEITVSSLAHEHLLGDKLRLNQILINLLSNAVKYTPDGGQIEFRIEELSQAVAGYSRVRFMVNDNGIGMSEDYLKVIFDPFTRENTEHIRKIQGTGLGMAITKSLVDLLKGVIHVESELDKGSSFTVELELRIQEREDADTEFWSDYHVGRIIIADDDEYTCQNIVQAMGKTGVVTDYSTDGAETIRMMQEAREAGRPYDLILLDWQMPGLDGLETARLIRKNYPDKIPIMLITAYDWSDIEKEAIEIGVSHFMPKPFFMSTFKDAIRRVMGHNDKDGGDDQDNVVDGKHILVVDDIEVNQIILVKILSSLGAVCEVASNGQAALEKFEAAPQGSYDLILMDVQMPTMDGYEATQAIRAGSHPEAKTIPIIAMTANAFMEDVRNAIRSGMDAHVAKPVQIETLQSTIRQVLQSRKDEENYVAKERG